jgi:hypothetical protein
MHVSVVILNIPIVTASSHPTSALRLNFPLHYELLLRAFELRVL